MMPDTFFFWMIIVQKKLFTFFWDFPPQFFFFLQFNFDFFFGLFNFFFSFTFPTAQISKFSIIEVFWLIFVRHFWHSFLLPLHLLFRKKIFSVISNNQSTIFINSSTCFFFCLSYKHTTDILIFYYHLL